MNKQGREKNGKYQKGREVPKEEKEKIGTGLLRNQNALKLKTDEARQMAYQAYCEWIASGRGRQGFVFEYKKDDSEEFDYITWQTMENYLKDKRFNLDPVHKEVAENLAYQTWENIGCNMMNGLVEKCQPAIYQMMMRNKFGWDKESKVTHTHEPDARRFMKICDEMDVPPKYESSHE